MIDKTMGFRQLDEGFRSPFSKGVFFDSFLLRLWCQKKAAKEFVHCNKLYVFGLHSSLITYF